MNCECLMTRSNDTSFSVAWTRERQREIWVLGYSTPSQVSCAQVVVAYGELLERKHSLGNQTKWLSFSSNKYDLPICCCTPMKFPMGQNNDGSFQSFCIYVFETRFVVSVLFYYFFCDPLSYESCPNTLWLPEASTESFDWSSSLSSKSRSRKYEGFVCQVWISWWDVQEASLSWIQLVSLQLPQQLHAWKEMKGILWRILQIEWW